MKKLAIIGRPNVGKSSFFNRLLRERDAITSEQAGTTRDVKHRIATILNKHVEVLDTGGLDKGCELFDRVREKSLEAAHSADIILYMVDGKGLPEAEDKKLFYELQSMGKDIALVVNKIDNDKMKEKLWEYYEFGTDEIFGISVSHNRSVNPLIQWIADHLPEEDRIIHEEVIHAELEEEQQEDEDSNFFYHDPADYDDENLMTQEELERESGMEVFDNNDKIANFDEEAMNKFRVAIIGRVNVGKSSLLNALLGKDRSVVSNVAGTTIDPIDETIEYQGKQITFVDTAGIRKRGKILGIEKFALMRTEKMLDNADIALLVIDASEPFLDLDEKIAGLIDKNRLSCLIVLNKWDLCNKDEYDKIIESVRSRFKFLHYAPLITISANSHQRVHKIKDMLLEINENYSQRIKTSVLNEVLEKAMRRHALPSMHGQRIRIYFATQYETRPPRIALIMNKPKGLHFTYRRYLTNKLREAFNFEGVPILIKAKNKRDKTAL